MSRINGHGPPLPQQKPIHDARIPESGYRRRGGKHGTLLHEKRLAGRRRRRWLRKRCSVTHAMNVNLGERRVLKMIRYWPRKQMDYAFVRLSCGTATITTSGAATPTILRSEPNSRT